MISYVLAIVTGLIVLGADQLTKYLVAEQFVLGESRSFLPGFMDLSYITNGGGAWGILKDHTWLLLSVTAIIMLICVAMLIKHGVKDKLLFWAICLVLCGGVGNMIDRIFRGGRVVDFLHFSFFDFPVFNVADCAVCIGAGLLILYFIIGLIRDEKQNKQKVREARAAKSEMPLAADPRMTTEKINVSEQKSEDSAETDARNGTD